MTQVGEEFRTGPRAPVSGKYVYARLTEPAGCAPTSEEREVTLSAGETFPPHRSCGRGAVWGLLRIRSRSRRGKTP